MPLLMFHHFSGHLPRTRKLCKFCKMMDQNFQTNRINPAKKILVICLGKTVFPLTLPKHFHFCRNCQTDCFHFQQFLPMLDIFSYMFTTTKTTAMDARRHEAKKALLYAKRKYREASSPAKMDPAMVRRQQEFDEMKLLLLEGQLLGINQQGQG